MSCYFRYMKDVREEAGIVVSKENKQPVDEIIHSMAQVEYKDCRPAWDVVKQQIKNDPKPVKSLSSNAINGSKQLN